MTFLLANWRVIAIGLLLLGVFGTGYYKGGQSVKTDWAAETAAEVKAQAAKNLADAEKLRKLEGTKNENIAEIDRLRANNHALWLRLPKTPCGGSGQTSGDTTAGSGELPEGAPSGAEQALNEFDKRWADEAYRADKVVEACRVLNDFAK